MTDIKSAKLSSILHDLGSFAVAFSGGVDSSFLLHRANSVNPKGIVAVTIRTNYMPLQEIAEAVKFTRVHGVSHKIIDIPFPEIIRNNPIERCYLCKQRLFSELLSFAAENNLKYVIDGTNADDTNDFRPGMKALKEMGIRSPLLEAGLSKEEIRDLSKEAGLSIWDKPAMACLMTRIPYDTKVTEPILRMIEAAEEIFLEKGYPGTRVRYHGEVARIECLPSFIGKIVNDPERDHIISSLKKIGFRYVSLDLEGYRKGSSNPPI